MPCNQNCNQGRNCNCKKYASIDRTAAFVIILLFSCIVSMCFGVYNLLHGTKGQDCAVEVQFKDSKATYIGTSI